MQQSNDLERRIQKIEDNLALNKLINDYLTLADQRRWQEWSETFTEDAIFDLPNSFGIMRGRQEIYDICVGKMEGVWADTQHMIVNTDFDVAGDTAKGTANIIFTGLPTGASETEYYMMGGRYRWQFVRTASGWKIADAWEEFIWNNGTPLKSVFDSDTASS